MALSDSERLKLAKESEDCLHKGGSQMSFLMGVHALDRLRSEESKRQIEKAPGYAEAMAAMDVCKQIEEAVKVERERCYAIVSGVTSRTDLHKAILTPSEKEGGEG